MKRNNSISESNFENEDLKINAVGFFIKPIYKNISFFEIARIELVKDHVIKGWILSFFLGLGISLFFIILIVNWTIYIGPTTMENVRRKVTIYISLVIMLLFGLSLVFLSLSKKTVIKIFTFDNKMYLYPLSNNKNQLSHIISFLKTCDVNLVNMLYEDLDEQLANSEVNNAIKSKNKG